MLSDFECLEPVLKEVLLLSLVKRQVSASLGKAFLGISWQGCALQRGTSLPSLPSQLICLLWSSFVLGFGIDVQKRPVCLAMVSVYTGNAEERLLQAVRVALVRHIVSWSVGG